MYLKDHISNGTRLIAICDRELVGQTFTDGALRLEVSEFFYKGELTAPDDVKNALKGAASANLVGERSVACALEEGFITKDNVLMIEGVPHAQMAMDAGLTARM